MSKLVKGIYGVLIVILLIQPHFFQGHLLFVPSPLIQSFITLVVLTIAFLLYYFHQQDIQKKEYEKNVLQEEAYTAGEKLLDSFQHIGKLNTRLPLFYQFTTDLLKLEKQTTKGRKHIFQTLLQVAVVSIAEVEWGMLRFIETSKQRTVCEFTFTIPHVVVPIKKISNKQLLATIEVNHDMQFLQGMKSIHSSDQQNSVQCFFIFPKMDKDIEDLPILQSIVDQSQILYHYINKV